MHATCVPDTHDTCMSSSLPERKIRHACANFFFYDPIIIGITLARINDLSSTIIAIIITILGVGKQVLVSFRIETASSCFVARNAFYDVRYRAHQTRSLATRLSTIKRRDRCSPRIVVRTRAKGSFAWAYLPRNCFIANGVSSTLNGNTNAGCEEQL